MQDLHCEYLGVSIFQFFAGLYLGENAETTSRVHS